MLKQEQNKMLDLAPFFDRYAQAFETFDHKQLVSFYCFPVTFDLADGKQIVFNDQKTFDQNNKQLFLIYKALEVIQFDVSVNRVVKLSHDSCIISVVWKFCDALGYCKQKLNSTYRVRETPAGVKIVCILLENNP